jgi:hypothetical protein
MGIDTKRQSEDLCSIIANHMASLTDHSHIERGASANGDSSWISAWNESMRGRNDTAVNALDSGIELNKQKLLQDEMEKRKKQDIIVKPPFRCLMVAPSQYGKSRLMSDFVLE